MHIRIKDDIIDFDEIILVGFNREDKAIFFLFKMGATIIYGQEYKPNQVPRHRVLTPVEYEKIHDYFAIDMALNEEKIKVIV